MGSNLLVSWSQTYLALVDMQNSNITELSAMISVTPQRGQVHFGRNELGEAALRHSYDLHVYVLMTNHVHLLVTRVTFGPART